MSDHVPDVPAHDGPTCLQAREEAAVSLLSRTDPPAAVLAHLRACPPCGAEFRELADLTALLDAARQAPPWQPAPVPSPLLLDRLLSHVGRRRRRRRITVGVALAAAAAAAVLPFVRGDGPGPDGPGVTASSSATLPVDVVAAGNAGTPGGPLARVWVERTREGATVLVSLRGMSLGSRCRLVVHDARGAAIEAGDWTVAAAESTYVEDVLVAPADVRRVAIVDGATGAPILDVPVRPV